MMYKMMLCCLFVSGGYVLSQNVSVNTDKKTEDRLSFDPRYIVEHKINGLSATIANKPDNKIIEDKGLVKGYVFNEAGMPVRYYYTVILSTQKKEVEVPAVRRKGKVVTGAHTKTVSSYVYDTISTHYVYDTNKNLAIKRTRYGDNYNSWYYEYNNEGMVVKQINARESNLNVSENDFKLGVQSVISREEFNYEKYNETQLKVNCLNDEGRIYKTIIINKNNNGNVINERHEYLVGGIWQEYMFEYDGQNRITKKSYSSNENGKSQTDEYQYVYDDKGLLVTEIHLKGDIKTNEFSYLYDENDNTLKSLLNRDFVNKSIGIIKYSWSYY